MRVLILICAHSTKLFKGITRGNRKLWSFLFPQVGEQKPITKFDKGNCVRDLNMWDDYNSRCFSFSYSNCCRVPYSFAQWNPEQWFQTRHVEFSDFLQTWHRRPYSVSESPNPSYVLFFDLFRRSMLLVSNITTGEKINTCDPCQFNVPD